MLSHALAAVALAAPALAAIAVPGGSFPDGNNFTAPSLMDIPPVGVPFDVAWKPNKQTKHGECDTIDIFLVYGQQSNLSIISALVTSYPNNGTFVWTPATDLMPAVIGYGLELVCIVSKDYQYTDMFGISNPGYQSPSNTATSASSETSEVFTTDIVTELTTFCPEATHITLNNKTYTVTEATMLTITDCPCTVSYTTSAPNPPVTGVPTTGYAVPYNTSAIQATSSVPSAYMTSSNVTSMITSSTMAPPTTAAPATTSAPILPASGVDAQFKASIGAIVAAVALAALVL